MNLEKQSNEELVQLLISVCKYYILCLDDYSPNHSIPLQYKNNIELIKQEILNRLENEN